MKYNFSILSKVWLKASIRDPGQFFRKRSICECSVCNYKGFFVTAKKKHFHPPFRCPNCESRPRDRQITLWLNEKKISLKEKKIIHFAPEWPLFRKLKYQPHYVGGDIIKRRNSNCILDITSINFEDNYFDLLICNHVLEHVVQDTLAMKECFRVMKKGSVGIFTVPISSDKKTWTPPSNMPRQEVERICGWDHKRIYGQDFEKKLNDVGFKVKKYKPSLEKQKLHGLIDENVYIAKK